jgi:hypothetical protein
MVHTIPLPRRATESRARDTPSAAAEQLRRRGWTARQVEYDASVDLDLRLRVAPGTEIPAVELLLPVRASTTPRWQAVRVCSADRAVWSGPPGTCPPEELADFLESLLLRPEEDLAARYQRLG